MKSNRSRILYSLVGVGTLMVSFVLWARNSSSARQKISAPYDWSHRHLIFSNPPTVPDTIRIHFDMRYSQQWAHRNSALALPAEDLLRSDWNDLLSNRPRRRVRP